MEWSVDFTCVGGPCNAFFYEIVIPPCPPLFTLGFNSGLVPMTQPVSSPVAEANSGLCKYTVNLYHGPGDLCQSLDPHIRGQARIPAVDPNGLRVLTFLLAGAAAWVLLRKRAAEGGGGARA